MVKKGKEKASAPMPQATASSSKSSSKKSSKAATGSSTAQNDDFNIVFTNSTKDPKPKRGAQGPGPGEPEVVGPPKPTVKQIIGGSSWTGKLPVNLLQEHCQRQKWDRPDYQPIRGSDDFAFFVQLSAKDPKTHETVKLPPFKLPPDYKHLVSKPTALEARHAAATYGLFRVCSMKNIHTSLPPDYKSLWKEFEALKKEDVKKGNAWLYDADPFATLKQREDEKAKAEKRRKEQEAIREKARNMPGASGLVLRGNASNGSGGGGNPMKGWTTVPKVEMGRKTRSALEDLLRREVIWNPHGVKMSDFQKHSTIKELTSSGFRKSHVEEAVEECKDREETLEWLLIHVPEDDLPKWALPGTYSAGVSVAATQDLKREAAITRLSQSGYSAELCKKLYNEHTGDEGQTAEALQRFLLDSGNDSVSQNGTTEEPFILGTPEECWNEEMESLASVYGDNYKRLLDDVCQIRIESVRNGPKQNIETFAQVRKSPRYPSEIILAMVADLPSYIKLSVVKKTLMYLNESLSEEPMKIYFAVDWIHQNINEIIEKPGKLREISGVASTAAEVRSALSSKRRQARHPKPLPRTVDMRNKEEWQRRQQDPALKQMVSQRQKLPAWLVKDLVVDTVAQNQVTIIAGETGSGKSTQSVQFILDDLYSRGLGNATNIVCTQPRRISALGLADRVSDERCSQLGREVGYTIRGENKTSPQTKITFVTTGVLLRRLQTSGGRTDDVVASLADVSHVVIDEVHERSLDTDFLLSIIRDVLKRRNDLKLVLMSATLDAATFQNYFTSEGLHVGLVEIAGRTYPVEDYYLDDIIRMTNFTVENDRYRDTRDEGVFAADTKGSFDAQDPINKIIQKLGSRINYSLLAETAKAIDADLHHSNKKGGILIFLPGVMEINRTVNQLRAISSLHVLPLHASLDTREQRRVFTSAPPGKRKVVVATNVAETSITIDDIVAVIDTGRVKETSFDSQNNMRKLEETWASRAACKQRRGRAGRVQAGKCYKLYTYSLEQRMAERPEPEIRRVALEQLCLSVRAMGTKDVGGFLARTPTPPAVTVVENAISMLQRMGALDGEELTALGQQMAMIPADLRCGKLMVYGAIFGCLDESITIAAILSTKSPFLSPPDKRDLAKEARARFSRGDGDLLTDLRGFQQWHTMMDEGTPQRQLRQFCDDNCLSYNTCSDISATRTQYYSALAEIGITENKHTGGPASLSLVRALTASAFTPQIARIQFPDKKFATSMSGAVELDPEAKTIRYFTQENGRVFIHPSSMLFDSQGFSGNAAFVSYFTMISTSKIFIRDLTPFNAFTLLLFSGAIELDTMGRGLLVDGWLRLRGWARIGVLVSRLRGMVDNIIAMKVNNPQMDVQDNEVIRLVAKLIELDGLDA